MQHCSTLVHLRGEGGALPGRRLGGTLCDCPACYLCTASVPQRSHFCAEGWKGCYLARAQYVPISCLLPPLPCQRSHAQLAHSPKTLRPDTNTVRNTYANTNTHTHTHTHTNTNTKNTNTNQNTNKYINKYTDL